MRGREANEKPNCATHPSGLLKWEDLYARFARGSFELGSRADTGMGGIETPESHKEPVPYTWAAGVGPLS